MEFWRDLVFTCAWAYLSRVVAENVDANTEFLSNFPVIDMKKPSVSNVYSKTVHVGGKEIKLEVGKFSEQAAAAVLATCGETVVHATVVGGRESTLDYFPLQVEYVEKLFAGGKIKGSRWVKRDGRPNDDAVLKGRLIDRAIRPLFPEGLKNEVQAIATVLSVDNANDPDMVAMVAISTALSISSNYSEISRFISLILKIFSSLDKTSLLCSP